MSIGKNSIDLLLTSSLLQILWGSMIHDWRPPLQTCCWLDLGDSGWRMQALQRIFLHMFYFAYFWRPDYCKLLQNLIYRRAASGLCRMWRRKMPSLVFGMHTLQSSQLVTTKVQTLHMVGETDIPNWQPILLRWLEYWLAFSKLTSSWYRGLGDGQV